MTDTRPLLAADRVRVYLTLVPYLLERGQVSVDEAAAEFGVTPDEMRAMIEKLTVIGLPGEDGYWQQPQEMFDIDWDLLDEKGIIEITNDVALRRVPRFTAREAAALIAGLQMVAAVPAVSDSGLVSGLLTKLARGTGEAPADVVIAPRDVSDVQTLVSRAVSDGVAVSFTYRAPDAAPTVRTVDPVQVLITDGQWYLQGWCHLREAMRTFHLDRVSDAQLTDIPITHGADSAPDAAASAATEGTVTVRIADALAPLLSGFRSEEVSRSGDEVILRLRMADPRGIKRFAARIGGRMQVLGPDEARAATRDWAAAGLALYHDPNVAFRD